ncbi:235_t:CDS:2 [Dentiscutata erythropus]|uniref:Nitrate reductase [NADPH] n=1 Tax=Dentiscutata erythropus TaxID=1348616 RepID=A0A9N8Z2A9_9GLOM|nr:235_t:CDS:2 [Dentiscutata erythropus]
MAATITNSIDPRDIGTPDDWIPRHPEMVRLTGKHPFNAEPPLSLLINQGFITPTPLHYVRNHGPVPKLHWDTHRLIVDGLVSKPLNLSMNDIQNFPYKEFPVTLVCAGNRSKEQNMIKQSIGFNWGSGAISCAIWKGVPLNDILKLAGVNLDDCINEPRYVCFTGADKLPNGYYGTNIPLEWSLNDINDVILAYEMNGERLTPDHGYPLRVIIPGFIGDRMVKWLSKITISNKESDSYYHYHDNRVLPPEFDAELATKENIWYNPNYIINFLNINSVITSPAHNEYILLSNLFNDKMYTIKGYAYAGGGNKVIRVEISLDDGKTWILSKLDQPELNHHIVLKRGINPIPKYWCWSFWSLTIPFYSFIRCDEISVRAWDSTQNTQPRNLTWNAMGMMNNCHFRVKINTIAQGSEFRLVFEHPTQPGNLPGGWMVKSEKSSPKLLTFSKNSELSTINSKISTFTINDVAKHNNEKDCWIIINKKIYNCTKFLKKHPGGTSPILINAGTDVTKEFSAIHSTKARELLKVFYIGDLVESQQQKIMTSETHKAKI